MAEQFYPGVDSATQRQFGALQERINEAQRAFQSPLSPSTWDTIIGILKSGDRTILNQESNDKIDKLKQGIASTERMLQQPSSQDILRAVTQHLEHADSVSQGSTMETQAAMRMLEFFEDKGARGKLAYQLVTDIDGTATNMNLYRRGIVDPLLVHSRLMDPLPDDPEIFLTLFSKVIQPLLRDHPELYEEGGTIVPLRKGMDALLREHQAKGGRLTALSTNTAPFIRAVMKRLGVDTNRIDISALSEDPRLGALAFWKNLVLQSIAFAHPEKMLIYLGDGGSDKMTLEEGARKVVGIYFALKDGSFAAELEAARQRDIREKGYSDIVYFTYEDGEDIQEKLQQIRRLVVEIANRQPARRASSVLPA